MFCPKLNIIVPCYNEEEMLPKSAPVLAGILNELIEQNQVSKASKICFVNDGSSDNTLSVMKKILLCLFIVKPKFWTSSCFVSWFI